MDGASSKDEKLQHMTMLCCRNVFATLASRAFLCYPWLAGAASIPRQAYRSKHTSACCGKHTAARMPLQAHRHKHTAACTRQQGYRCKHTAASIPPSAMTNNPANYAVPCMQSEVQLKLSVDSSRSCTQAFTQHTLVRIDGC
jgi:hypothetical protein